MDSKYIFNLFKLTLLVGSVEKRKIVLSTLSIFIEIEQSSHIQTVY